MTAFLRDCSPELAAALANGSARWVADLITFTLADGETVLRMTSWDSDLTANGHAFASRAPWIARSGWEVSNTLQVPSMSVQLLSLNDGFAGGSSLKAQIGAGLFDAAGFLLEQAFMATPGDTAALGTIALFGGKVGPIDLDGIVAELTIKGRVNDLDQYAPRNLYQVGCNRAFCDVGCGLDRGDYTASYTAGSSPSTTFVPWSAAPSNPGRYQGGTLSMTSGAAAGSRRAIAKADIAGLTLAYPLNVAPAAADAFDAFEGCDKSYNSGSVQSCTARSNTARYRGFDLIPPPATAV